MRSDSEVLAQISSDVAEIKAAVFSKNKAQEPFRAGLPPEKLRKVWAEWESIAGPVYVFTGAEYRCSHWPSRETRSLAHPTIDWHWPSHQLRPHGATWEHVERLAREREERVTASLRADLASEGPKGNDELTDLRKLEGRVCQSKYPLVGRLPTSLRRFAIQAGELFRVINAEERNSILIEISGIFVWIPPLGIEVVAEPPRLNYRYPDVVLRADVVASIRPKSEAFTISTTRLNSLVAFKPERLAVSLSQSMRWQIPTKISRAECLDLSHLTIMRIRAGDKDVITEPVSAQSQSLGGGFAWPAVRADSEIEITLAISKSVLDRVLPPFGLTKGDLRWVAVRVGLILTGSTLT